MFSITEPKIAGLRARWAPFPGFSLLFDNPGPLVAGEGIETLGLPPEAEFYRRLHMGYSALGPDRLSTSFGLLALPPASYHVTAFDVMNVADLARCRPECRLDLQATLDALPAPSAFEGSMLQTARESKLVATPQACEFGYGGLALWGGVLAVRLKPRDETVLARFVGERATLSERYWSQFGVGARREYTPHVSLGYFATAEGPRMAGERVAEWDAAFRERMGEATLAFQSVSLYGFTDMATFFRRTPYLGGQ